MQKPLTYLSDEETLEQDIIEGCREMADVYLEIQREFEPLDTALTRAFYPEYEDGSDFRA